MYFVKTLVALVAAAAMVSATPSINKRAEGGVQARDNCGNTLGDCYSNNCSPSFKNPSDTTGICQGGNYVNCPCEKCGGGVGFEGSCGNNGCNGVNNKCTAGNYDGCPCN